MIQYSIKKKYHTVGAVPKFNRKIVEEGKNDNPHTDNDCSRSALDIDTSPFFFNYIQEKILINMIFMNIMPVVNDKSGL